MTATTYPVTLYKGRAIQFEEHGPLVLEKPGTLDYWLFGETAEAQMKSPGVYYLRVTTSDPAEVQVVHHIQLPDAAEWDRVLDLVEGLDCADGCATEGRSGEEMCGVCVLQEMGGFSS